MLSYDNKTKGRIFMAEGFFLVRTTLYNEAMPIQNARIYIRGSSENRFGAYNPDLDASSQNYDFYLISGSDGKTPTVTLEAPDSQNSFESELSASAYSLYDVYVERDGFVPIFVRGVQIYPGITSELPLDMEPFVTGFPEGLVRLFEVPENAVSEPVERERQQENGGIITDVLPELVIPSSIVVHLGVPDDANAENLTVSFTDYIKNVASSEIFPTWDEAAIRANILAQISLTLNRIYTEWYPSRGYPFQITNSTRYDQAFVKGRNIYDNISLIVDDIFNNFIRREGNYEPLFAQYCDGIRTSCEGMSQWGSQRLAEQGYDSFSILQNYYGNDIELASTENIADSPSSYPGTPLRIGDVGENVLTVQIQLDRIRRDYPLIPRINRLNGRFNDETQSAVRVFQEIFDLTPDGVVGKATWYNIARIYTAVTRLGEITSEGTSTFIPDEPPNVVLSVGDSGSEVRLVQYILEYLSFFFPSIPILTIDGYFGSGTENSVKGFQQTFGLDADGIVGEETWRLLYRTSSEISNGLSAINENQDYPGAVLRVGSTGEGVELMKKYYNRIASFYGNLPTVAENSDFDAEFENAIKDFQSRYGLEPDGVIGALTWTRIVELYNFIRGIEELQTVSVSGALPSLAYPGIPIRRGIRGRHVKYIQSALNTVYEHIGMRKYLGVTGDYGCETESSVIGYQKRRRLVPDGIVGEDTWNTLISEAESYGMLI